MRTRAEGARRWKEEIGSLTRGLWATLDSEDSTWRPDVQAKTGVKWVKVAR